MSTSITPPSEQSKSSNSDLDGTKPINKGRKHFIFVCIAFLLPIILAKFALEQQWFNYGVTNEGQLLEEPVSLTDLQLSDLHELQKDKGWLVIYNQPLTCATECQKTFNLLSNTYVALGKEMPRVLPIALVTNESQVQLASLAKSNRWQFHTPSVINHELLANEQVLIVDPLGNVVMTHQVPSDESLLPAFGKSILADMKKLLKYSRIG